MNDAIEYRMSVRRTFRIATDTLQLGYGSVLVMFGRLAALKDQRFDV